MEEQFDVNNPDESLEGFAPDINPTEAPELLRSAPPDDGVHWAIFKADTKRQGGPVYYKDIVKNAAGVVVDGKVITSFSVRVEDAEGKEGAFLKNYYASTTPQGPKKGTSLGFILAQGKRPLRAGSTLPAIKAHTEQVLAETAETGIRALVKTRWVLSKPQMHEAEGIGWQYTLDANQQKIYTEVKGQDKIIALAIAQAEQEVLFWTADEDESAEDFATRKEQHVTTAPARAHIWFDNVANEERSCQAEIQSLEDPRKYSFE